MAGKKFAAVVLASAFVSLADVAAAANACVVPGLQEQAVVRSGHIPGLGDVTGSVGWDGKMQLTLSGRDFEMTRTIMPSGEYEITVSGRGELIPLTIRIGRGGLRIARGANVVWGTSSLSAIRTLTDGSAVAALREHIGDYERRLIAGVGAARPDDPHAYGFLLAGAFVSSLAGDPSAIGRARDLIVRRIQGQLRAAGAQFKDCVTEYENALLANDTRRTSCLQSANEQDSWWQRAEQRLLCEAEFLAGALSAEAQFISCSALLPLVK